jgi:hypothetical protein
LIQFFPGREYINSVQEKKNEAEFLFLIRQIALHTWQLESDSWAAKAVMADS